MSLSLEKDERETPQDLFDDLHREFGFTLDAAATEINAKLPRFSTQYGTCTQAGDDLHDWDPRDGLTFPWENEIVFCNPPFSQLQLWMMRGWTGGTVVMVLPQNRQEQRSWQTLVEPYRDRVGSLLTTRNMPNRRHFTINGGQPIINPKTGKRSSPEFGLVILIWDRRVPPSLNVRSLVEKNDTEGLRAST